MFDGVPDQFHQFLASRASLPIPLSFPLHGVVSSTTPQPNFPTFDPYPSLHQQHVVVQQQQQNSLHQQLQQQQQVLLAAAATSKDEKKEEQSGSSSTSSLIAAASLVLESDRSIPDHPDPWSNDEVLALLRIRSSMETWYPDFTWEHVSRKLAEVGFKRSAEKCKEKFEEESRHFNSFNSFSKSVRFFTELDELYNPGNESVHVPDGKDDEEMEKRNEEAKEKEEEGKGGGGEEAEDVEEVEEGEEHACQNIEEDIEEGKRKSSNENNKSKKRKRKHKFEMVKGFCEAIVKKIMAQQEELHNKFMEEILRRDEEMIAREEARKHEEMARLNLEIELRAKEQALANDRQTILIDLLKNFTSSSGPSSNQNHQILAKKIENYLKMSSSMTSGAAMPQKRNRSDQALVTVCHQNPRNSPTQKSAPSSSSETQSTHHNPSSSIQPTMPPNETSSSTISLNPQNPNSSNKVHETNPLPNTPSSSFKGSNEREDVGKRWPRDEVLALINLRCSLISSSTSNSNASGTEMDNNRDGSSKGPLWERISQGMHQMGYKRSAKRCKEKWENINKYFRKTKDNNKKRSLDSRTCPYYHQLSSLYSQGVLVAPTDTAVPENRHTWPKNHQGDDGGNGEQPLLHGAEEETIS